MPTDELDPGDWGEEASKAFIDYGHYFVPDRDLQIRTIVDLVAPIQPGPFSILELCCGEGYLAEALLERYPDVWLVGFDGASEMLGQAEKRLARFGGRFELRRFDLADLSWRKLNQTFQAVVSSLALHHLKGAAKRTLYADMHAVLSPGGSFIIADIIEPTHPLGWKLAAQNWDEVVRQNAIAIDGHPGFLESRAWGEWNIFRHFDPEDIDFPSPLFDQLRWLQEVGFAPVDVFWMRAGHAIFGGWK